MNAHAPVLKWLVSLKATACEADWEALYQQELPRIYNFFRYRIGDDALAEDLTSMTFEKAWRARHQHRRDSAAFSTWLFAIARNGPWTISDGAAWSYQSMSWAKR